MTKLKYEDLEFVVHLVRGNTPNAAIVSVSRHCINSVIVTLRDSINLNGNLILDTFTASFLGCYLTKE